MTKELASIACDSVRIEGVLELPDDPLGVVLFAHGSGSGRLSPRNNFVAGILRGARLGTLLLDLLTPAEETALEARFDIELLTRRLHTAALWLRQEHATRALPLGLFGASTGAAAALRVAALPDCSAGAVVSRGGRPDLAGRTALEKVGAPTLLIVGSLDHGVIELNQAAYASLHCEKQFALVPGASHLFEEPGTLESVAELARAWFVRHLALPGTETVVIT